MSTNATAVFDWMGSGRSAAPWVPVSLTGPGGETADVMMLVDTGADISILPKDLAAPLGIDATRLVRSSAVGVGGSTSLWRARAAHLRGRIALFEISFDEIDFSVSALPPILGRDALFGPLEVRLYRGTTELRRR